MQAPHYFKATHQWNGQHYDSEAKERAGDSDFRREPRRLEAKEEQ